MFTSDQNTTVHIPLHQQQKTRITPKNDSQSRYSAEPKQNHASPQSPRQRSSRRLYYPQSKCHHSETHQKRDEEAHLCLLNARALLLEIMVPLCSKIQIGRVRARPENKALCVCARARARGNPRRVALSPGAARRRWIIRWGAAIVGGMPRTRGMIYHWDVD